MSKKSPIEFPGLEKFMREVDARGVHRPDRFEAAHSRMKMPCIDGYATLYSKPHVYKGRIEVFHPGCFSRTLRSSAPVKFQLDHEGVHTLASTRDCLTLVDREPGLAFRLRVPQTPLGEVVARLVDLSQTFGMSVGYRVVADEIHHVSGRQVRFITDADLQEISLVKHGAVNQAFAELVDGALVEPPTATSVSPEFRVAYAFHRHLSEARDLRDAAISFSATVDEFVAKHAA